MGLHHITAIAGDPQRNLDFYSGVLGLRFVKRTVNFDDPQTYHFYFGDETGSPGSLLTFFPWPGAERGRVGPGQVAVISLAAPVNAIGFWLSRLIEHGIPFEGPRLRSIAGIEERALSFRDPDGLMLEIVGSAHSDDRPGWSASPEVPDEHALRGVHAVTLWVADVEPTARVLDDLLGFRMLGEEESTRRHEHPAAPRHLVDVRTTGDFVRGVISVGTVHHIAWVVEDDAALGALREWAVAAGLRPTGILDRTYFRSVYFREPGGTLFELATAGPGFLIDEDVATLGARLMLPPQYESLRTELERALPEIHPPGARRTYGWLDE